ncbi:MAG: metallophosphoesterase, partial [Brevundimonas sp.]
MTDAPQPPSSAPSLASGQTPQPGLEPGPAKKMRVAAVGDLHVGEDARRPYRDLFERVSDEADVLC